jgi:hypothetical protein
MRGGAALTSAASGTKAPAESRCTSHPELRAKASDYKYYKYVIWDSLLKFPKIIKLYHKEVQVNVISFFCNFQ